jgi:CDP-glycerol glycerophosphotransferase
LKIDERLNDFVIDLSFYDDVCQLCLISDILITDYSSVFFDYAHSRRPILFFVPDLEHYVSEVRGLYLNMETDMPGPLIKDNDYLIECIENIDAVEKEYKERYDKFYEKFCSLCKGHSSEEIIKRVFELEEQD